MLSKFVLRTTAMSRRQPYRLLSTARRNLNRNNLPKFTLLGVPEQVNLPIQRSLEKGTFLKYGVDVNYITVPEGTGAMLSEIHNNKADLAITVTDGFIAGQASGYDVQLVGTYVDSPLTWAASTHPNSPYDSIEELFQNKENVNVGISRLQSGSHTMSFYMTDLLEAKMRRRDHSYCDHSKKTAKEKLKFKVLGSFPNLRKGILKEDIDIFLWEVFTTKPYFDSGDLKYIGEISTPWPAFSIISSSKNGIFQSPDGPSAIDAFRNRFLPALSEEALHFKLNTLSSSASLPSGSVNEKNNDLDSVSLIAERFRHRPFDAQRWLDMTHYALPDMSVDAERMTLAVQTLKETGLIPSTYSVSQLWEGRDAVDKNNNAISFRHDAVTSLVTPSLQEDRKRRAISLMSSELW